MLYSLRGTVILSEFNTVVIECGGVGYKCVCPAETVAEAMRQSGKEMKLLTHLQVSENDISLFGFKDQASLDTFKLLIGVNGVGPKVAIAILSSMPVDKLTMCIASGDAKALTTAQGVGSKLAQRIILELKDKMQNVGSLPAEVSTVVSADLTGAPQQEAIQALLVLGYSQSEAASAVASQPKGLKTDDIIRNALKSLASFK